jgi:hypothetical protein
MNIRFLSWNVRSLYRIDSLKMIARELGKCKLDLVGIQRSDGRRMALNGQRIIHFPMEKGMDRFFLYIRVSYLQFGE